jgi:hypothetical protein
VYAATFVGPPRPPAEPGVNPGLFAAAGQWAHGLQGLAHARLRLAALETQQAGRSLVTMVAGALVAAGLLLAAWIALLATGCLALVSASLLGPQQALLLACLLNLLMLLLTVQGIRRCSRGLSFGTARAPADEVTQ